MIDENAPQNESLAPCGTASLAGLSDVEAGAILDEAEARLSAAWRARVVERLAGQMDRDLRGDAPKRLPNTEEAAMSFVRGAADELKAAALALDRAARVLKDKANLGVAAEATHSAAKRAHAAAQELLG